MKRATYNAIANVLANIDFANKEQIMSELNAEINKGAEEKEAKNAEYTQVWQIVEEGMRTIKSPTTIAELYSEIVKELPQGFTKGRLQYGMTHQWSERVDRHENAKGANTYTLKA